MPLITGQQIVDRAWIKAMDTNGGSGIRWPADEALRWLNDGQREVVNQLPSAYTLSANPTVVAGTRQTLAGLGLTTGIQFIDVPRNFNLAGTVPGRAITLRKREWFDDNRPAWHNEVAAEAMHFVMDPRDPKAIYLYPAITSGKIEVIYSAAPPDLGSLAAVISIDDIYANALQFFMLFSMYSKDASYTNAPAKAGAYFQMFMQSLGKKAENTMANVAMAAAASSAGVSQ